MITRFLRFWYRITGKKDEMEITRRWMKIFGMLDPTFDYVAQWRKDYGHIAKVYEDKSA